MVLLATSLGLIIAASLAFALFLLDSAKGVREPLWALGVCLAIGLAAATAAGVLNAIFLPADIFSLPATTTTALQLGFVPAIIEELLKTLPIVWFLGQQPFFDDYVDGVIFFAFSGLAFGVYENIDYTLRFGAQVGVGRLATMLFFHAATAGIFGYAYARSRRDGQWLRAILVMLGIISVHALYNYSLVMMREVPALRFVALVLPMFTTAGLIAIFIRARRLDRQPKSRRSQ